MFSYAELDEVARKECGCSILEVCLSFARNFIDMCLCM